MSLMANSPVILALDTKDIDQADSLINETSEFVGVFKLGLEFFIANGLQGVVTVAKIHPQARIFLDLKLHDIPNTVAKAATNLRDLNVEFLTVHASGGSAMISAAANALPNCKIVAVTLLTSLDKEELQRLDIGENPERIVVNWAKLAVQAGARAIVASPLEVKALRANLPREIELITPGIRFEAGADDQMRTMTPADAISAGSDYLVVGRPITAAANPREAAQRIFQSISK